MNAVNEQSAAYRMGTMGMSVLNDTEMLSLVLGGDNPMNKASKLLEETNFNLREICKMSLADMKRIGLTAREARVLAAAVEFGRRKQIAEVKDKDQIKSSADAARIFTPIVADLSFEEFHVMYLNRSNKVLKITKISQGGISGTVTDVRIILKEAISLLASGMILCHNHPSGNMNPSECDSKITQKIKDAGNLCDVQVLDHIIIAENNYYSFADNGML